MAIQAKSGRSRPWFIGRRDFLSGAAAASLLPPPARAAGGPSLRVLLARPAADNLAPIVEAFERDAGLAVELVTMAPFDVSAALLVSTMDGSDGYDIAIPPTFDVPDLVAAGAIAPLDPARAGPPSLYDEGDFFDDTLFARQTDGDVYLAFYNRRVLEDERLAGAWSDRTGTAFGIPTDWDTFDAQILFVENHAEDLRGAYLPRVAERIPGEFWMRLLGMGLWPLSPTLEPQIASPEGVAALEAMMRIAPALAGDLDKMATFERWEEFEKGQIFAALGWGGVQKFLRRPDGPGFDPLHAAPPGGGAGRPAALPMFNMGWSYTVSRNSTQPAAARAFIELATSREMALASVQRRSGFFDPFREEHYDDRLVRELYGDGFLKVHRDAMAQAVPDFYLAKRGEFMAVLANWLTLAFGGTIAPAVALERAADDWRGLIDAADRPAQTRRWNQLRGKYPAAVSAMLRDLPGTAEDE